MANQVYVSTRDVIVVLRHDPCSSDIVSVAAVLDRDFFGVNVPDDAAVAHAETWGIEREIEAIKAETEGDEGPLTDEQRLHVASLTPDNFTRKTDLWFEVELVALFDEEAGPGEGAGT